MELVMPRIYTRVDPAIRFAAKYVVLNNGCWQWIAGSSPTYHGFRYGMFRPGGRDDGQVNAHRWSYQYHRGAIPQGMVLDHLCRNTLCVNPDHLEIVTNSENILRGVSPNRTKTHCIRGHEFTPENTRIGKRGNRICRKCKAWHQRRYNAAH